LRILFLGDLVGRAGRDAAEAAIPRLREALRLDLVVVNAEKASHGFGLAPEMARALFAAGADCVTLGNHAWDRKEIIPYIETEPRLLRPLNYPPGTPGRGAAVIECGGGRRALVMNAMGRLFMEALDDPVPRRAGGDRRAPHGRGRHGRRHGARLPRRGEFGEAGDGPLLRREAFAGRRHAHPHALRRPHDPAEGTAYMTDAGMCGDYDSVIGMQKGAAALRFWRKVPGERLSPAEGEATGLRRLRGDGRCDRPRAPDRAAAPRRAAEPGHAGGLIRGGPCDRPSHAPSRRHQPGKLRLAADRMSYPRMAERRGAHRYP
jgi:hypothetical protein